MFAEYDARADLYAADKKRTEENTVVAMMQSVRNGRVISISVIFPTAAALVLTLLTRAHRTHRTLWIAFVKKLVLRARCEMAANMGFSLLAAPPFLSFEAASHEATAVFL